jgi:hypothetical protein
MRAIFACLVTLTVCGSARADVFVPADPAGLGRADCAAAEHDVLAAGDGDTIRVRLGDSPFVSLDGTFGCPTVAAAADGTVAVLADGGLVARRLPGGTFSAPMPIAGEDVRVEQVALAVAPGGWTVVTWIRDGALTARVFRPDGTTADATLLRHDAVTAGPVGIDSTGTVTTVWTSYASRTTTTRVARFAPGSPVTVSELRDSGTTQARASTGVRAVALSVAPAGGTLLAWVGAGGVQIMLDGGAPVVVDAATPAVDALAASRADDGTALVGYLRGDDELVTVQRSSAGWQAPQGLWSGARRFAGPDSAAGDGSRAVRTTIAPDGSAAVVWTAPVEDEAQVFGAVARAGGPWGPASRLSSIARFSYLTSLAPDAAGVPRVLWSESGHGVRGATVAQAQLDVTPPVVTTRFPARLPRTRTARLRFSVRVTCSEACDARLSVSAPANAVAFDQGDFVRTATALAPGRPRTLRVHLGPQIAHELLRNPKARALRLRLTLTDRAGNLVRRATTLRVRVIEPPIHALKVPTSHDFGMQTPAANRLVATLVNDLIDRAARGGTTDETLHHRYRTGIAAIRRAGHPEVTRSRVRARIHAALDIPLTRAGLNPDFVLS